MHFPSPTPTLINTVLNVLTSDMLFMCNLLLNHMTWEVCVCVCVIFIWVEMWLWFAETERKFPQGFERPLPLPQKKESQMFHSFSLFFFSLSFLAFISLFFCSPLPGSSIFCFTESLLCTFCRHLVFREEIGRKLCRKYKSQPLLFSRSLRSLFLVLSKWHFV